MAFKIKDGVRIGTVDVFNNSGTLLVNAPTATKWETARTITLGGDLTGNVNIDGSANVTLTATIAADSVALGTDTTGNYVAGITAGTAITVSGSGSENATVTINHADTSTLDGVQGGNGIASITVDGNGHVTAVSTATYLTSYTETDTLQTVTGRGATSNVATISLTANTASTTTGTGTLVVTGGVGIGGALNVGGAGSISGNLTVGGNLTVNGSTTIVNSTTVTIDDPIFTLGGDTAPASDDNKDRGIEFRWHNGSTAKLGFFGFDDSTGKFTFIPDATNSSEVFSGTKGELDANVAWSNITGSTTVGDNLVTLTNPSAITFLRVNADNTVSTLNAADFRTAIGAGTSSTTGTVTSVALTVPTGLQVSGSPITTNGTLAVSFASGYSIPTTAKQTEWDTAFTERNRWDGGATGLTASTGRTSLGATTVGSNLFTLTNHSAITFLRVNADNSVSTLNAADFRTAIGAGTSSTTGTVTSIATNNGITGGTITSSGTIGLTGQALALHNLASNGIIVRTGTDTVAARSLVAGTNVSITNADGVSGNITINASFTEADTLATVTGRGNTTTTDVQLNNSSLLLAPSTTPRIYRRAVQPAAINVNTITTVDSWATATYRSAKYTVQVVQGSKYQLSEVNLIHDGTTVYLTEFSVLENNSIPVTFSASIAAGTLSLRATITDAATTNATVTMERVLFAI